MTLAPLLNASPVIQFHVLTVIIAIALTPVILLRPKGNVIHKVAGRVWVAAMALTALASLLIPSNFSPWHFGPIHLLSFLVLFSLISAVRDARAGNIRRHRATMRHLAFWALLVTGAFTLVPGRIMSTTVFGA